MSSQPGQKLSQLGLDLVLFVASWTKGHVWTLAGHYNGPRLKFLPAPSTPSWQYFVKPFALLYLQPLIVVIGYTNR